MPGHRIVRSKMKKTGLLLSDPILSRHVPETHWFSKERLERMLHAHSAVYVKPDQGRKGIGVCRLKLLNSFECELAHENTTKRLPFLKAVEALGQQFALDKSYIIQEGIELATYQERPFHIRVVMQKPMERWRLSLMSGIVAKREQAVVTNVAQGNLEHPVEEVLQKNDQRWNPFQAFRELIDLSHQIAYVLGSQLPLLVIGLDMGIDKQGKVWFIEANTNPDCSGMRKLNDILAYQKYLEAKKWIRELQADE